MNFMLDVQISEPEIKINYNDPILLTGSCFTEHIGNYLKDLKFNILQNPNGILFDPQSVATSIVSYIQDKKYNDADIFYLNELWQSWQHHSIFSNADKDRCLQKINQSQTEAHSFLSGAKWLSITLGSAFLYRLSENKIPVANCHRAPAQMFTKYLMTIEEINSVMDNCIHQLFKFNPHLRIILTVSPVRHIRDGVIENNRSKARLIEAVHHLANKFERIYYFPAYELVIDVLRDYRFYDTDMVHPNYAATEFVLEKFVNHFIDEPSQLLIQEIKKIVTAKKHKPFHPGTNIHRIFLKDHLNKTILLKERYPFLNFDEEMDFFSSTL